MPECILHKVTIYLSFELYLVGLCSNHFGRQSHSDNGNLSLRVCDPEVLQCTYIWTQVQTHDIISVVRTQRTREAIVKFIQILVSSKKDETGSPYLVLTTHAKLQFFFCLSTEVTDMWHDFQLCLDLQRGILSFSLSKGTELLSHTLHRKRQSASLWKKQLKTLFL